MNPHPVTPLAPTRCFAAHLDAPVPQALRAQAHAKSFDEFVGEYAPSCGPLRLGQWTCDDGDRPAGRLGPQARNYRATLAVGDRIGTARAAACGPVAALTTMLYDRGISLELTDFHQVQGRGHTVTFVRGCRGAGAAQWAMGWSPDATQSALRAVIACGNRLLS